MNTALAVDPIFAEFQAEKESPEAIITNNTTAEFAALQAQHTAVYEKRLRIIAKLRDPNSAKAAHARKFLRTYYKWNPIDFIEDWVTTFDPRLPNPYMPMLLFPRQKEYIRWVVSLYLKRSDGLTEKSRDMGVTWLTVAIATWLWNFYEGVTVAFGSRKEALVDKIGDPDSIFEKIRMVLRDMPKELLPIGYEESKHAPFMKIENKECKSIIKGEAGDNIGRGGRSSIYFKDESAFYERPEKIEAALSQNSDCKIDVSTPNGTGNPFYQKRFSNKLPVFIFDWRDDPRKDQAWYDKQVNILAPVIVAQEIDRDYAASVENICIPAKYVKAAIGLILDNEGDWFGSFDVANEGGDNNALGARKGVTIKHVEGWKTGNTSDNTDKVYDTLTALGCCICGYDSDGVGAGVKGEASRIASREEEETGMQHFHFVGISSGGKVSSGWFSENRRKKDVYYNHKAENWWQARIRFEKTWKHVNGICEYPHDELIALPPITDENREHMEQLITELSIPKYKRAENGKIQIESKKELKARGIDSPDYADMLVNLFSEKLYTVDLSDIQITEMATAHSAAQSTLLSSSTMADL